MTVRAASMTLATSARNVPFYARELFFRTCPESLTMAILVIAVLMFALVAAVLALCREVRLRQALERLLQIVLNRWRSHVSRFQDADCDAVDPLNNPDERL
jgi:hypothetical protein